MSFTLSGLILFLIIAAICGALGRAIGGEVRGGIFVSIALGFLGAMFGPWIAAQLHLGEPLTIQLDGHPFPILWSILGAAALVAIIHLVTRAGRTRATS